ncbi:uncharacterized protein HMPREF1541_04542 [Cyphellophora europaea CBS 101466]|uniref:Amidoligase enzyme n=1 Tax=Cyphellophora europaea (strain CBS 101466) TaxID=1220924 RepID=W2RUS1_CYPE1|nr:uncharacterized protein HMPREF1541_04542 [Cyphellophora europaea CBS 101466]ETN40266.1 hypothetical protein HMPREF1541_04542 [Cyphellophora europaea CBS 101466]
MDQSRTYQSLRKAMTRFTADYVAPTDFQPMLFGTELEILVKFTNAPIFDVQIHERYNQVAEYLSQQLTLAGIRHYKHESGQPADYTQWALTTDGSIPQDHAGGVFGFELVSPIQQNTRWPAWLDNYETMYLSLRQHFTLVDEKLCGTHVHVSPLSAHGWFDHFEALKRVAKAVIYFERCVDSLMPLNRLKVHYCRSNRYNPIFRGRSIQSVLEMIDSTGDPTALAHLMCSDGNDGSSHRYYRWNFTRLTDASVVDPIDPSDAAYTNSPKCHHAEHHQDPYANQRKGTIEFRQPPGSLSFAQAEEWSQFAVGFVVGAMACVTSDHESAVDMTRPADLNALQRILRVGVQAGQVDVGNLLAHIFDEKAQLPNGPFEKTEIDPAELPRLKAKRPVDDANDERFFLASFDGLLEDIDDAAA